MMPGTIRIEGVTDPRECGHRWIKLIGESIDGRELHAIIPIGAEEGRCPSCGLVWKAEGADDALTTTPSYVCDWGEGSRVHLFVRGGRLEMVSDSTLRAG